MRYALYFILTSVLIGCSSDSATEERTSTPQTVNDQSSAGLAPETDLIVIDVRSKDEWDSGHVSQAVHIPHTEIAERIGEVTEYKDAKIVVYCAVGGRAGKAKEKLEELGFTNVENAGGYNDIKLRFERAIDPALNPSGGEE